MRLYGCNGVQVERAGEMVWTPSVQPIAGNGRFMPVRTRGGQRKFLVLDYDATSERAGTYDLGDPQNPADMNRTLTNPEASTVAGMFADDPNVNNRTFRGFTIIGVVEWCDAEHPKQTWSAFIRALFEVT